VKTPVVQHKGIEREIVTATTQQTWYLDDRYFTQLGDSDVEHFWDRFHRLSAGKAAS
jgi:hypothetical protein